MEENKIVKTKNTEFTLETLAELAQPYFDAKQKNELEIARLEHEITKMRIIGDSHSDLRNKVFVGSMLFVSIVSASLLGYFGKLNEGLLTIFSMLIGGLFTAYATAIKWGSGKSKNNTDTNSELD